MNLLSRWRDGLRRTTQQIVGRFDDLVRQADARDRRSQPLGADTVDTTEALEEILMSADVGSRQPVESWRRSASDRGVAGSTGASQG